MKLNNKIWNDAAELSAYILDRNADRIAAGRFSVNQYQTFLDLCRRVAQLTGEELDTVIDQIVDQARA